MSDAREEAWRDWMRERPPLEKPSPDEIYEDDQRPAPRAEVTISNHFEAVRELTHRLAVLRRALENISLLRTAPPRDTTCEQRLTSAVAISMQALRDAA